MISRWQIHNNLWGVRIRLVQEVRLECIPIFSASPFASFNLQKKSCILFISAYLGHFFFFSDCQKHAHRQTGYDKLPQRVNVCPTDNSIYGDLNFILLPSYCLLSSIKTV